MDERKFESYMRNQRPKKKQGNKKNGKKHHVYAVIVLLLAAAIIIVGGMLLFYIQEIEVSGNEYCDSQEIVNCVQNDKMSGNSLYVVAKYSMGKGTVPECLDSLKVRMKNPWTLQITVKEKAITGCVKTGTTYSYFDQSGLVVKQSSVKDAQTPVVEGLKIKSGKLYKQIRTSDQTKFNEILEACAESQKYGIHPENVTVKQQQIYMKFGNVSACLGNQVSGEQIAQIKPILKKLGDKEGILHLETYSENNTTITFEMKEISQEN